MERVFYEDETVRITSSLCIAGRQVHAIAGILSAETAVLPPSRGGWIAGLLVGLAGVILGGWAGKLLGLIAVCACGLVLLRQKAVHSVSLRSASGMAELLSGTDGNRAARVAAALNEAIACHSLSSRMAAGASSRLAENRSLSRVELHRNKAGARRAPIWLDAPPGASL